MYQSTRDMLGGVRSASRPGKEISVGLDILPDPKGEDSAKRSSRLHVSSVAKYAFASHVSGRRSIVTEGVRSSAFSCVKTAFRPGHAERFYGTNTVRPSTAGHSARTVPRVASPEALRHGLESDLLPRGTWTRSVRPSEAGVSRRGNSGRLLYESEWHEDVGFIPARRAGISPRTSVTNCSHAVRIALGKM